MEAVMGRIFKALIYGWIGKKVFDFLQKRPAPRRVAKSGPAAARRQTARKRAA
jgi:hypothetical protein